MASAPAPTATPKTSRCMPETSRLVKPFGLPKETKVEEYRADPLCTLSSLNYKVEASINTHKDTWRPLLSVLDTGAGPNLIRADLLPEPVLHKLDTSREVVNLSSASGHGLDVLGITRLSVKVGSQVTTHDFVVSRQLSTDVLLGCHFIDNAVEDIHVQLRTVELLNGELLPIVRRKGTGAPTTKSLTESPKLSPRAINAHQALRVTTATVVPPRTQMFVPVQGSVRGLQIISARPELFDKYHCTVANGLADVRPTRPFHVQVANLSERPVTLHKRMRIAFATPAPSTHAIFSVSEDPIDVEGTMDSTVKEGVEVDTPQPHPGALSPQESRAWTHLNTKKAQKPNIFEVEDIPLDELDDDQQEKVRDMLRPFKEMWRPGRVGKVNVTEHYIDIKPGARPQYAQPYRAGPYARKVIQNTIDEMLEQDIIEPARSEWAAPVVLAPKPDGTLRFCVDYRRLNSVTIKDRYPLPRMEDCLDSLGEAQFFSTLDCNWGFWQIPLAEQDRQKTAFTTFAGPYQYKRMPFGLCNAPATYQRTLDILLAGLKWQTCLVYVDDVIVFSKSFDQHLTAVADVLHILQEAGLSMNMRKCKFFSRTVDYLGHVVRPGRLAVAEKNTEAVRRAKYPSTQTELRSFLGTCNVYRRFVPNFAHVAAPLNQLLTKGQDSRLPSPTDEQIRAFSLLKTALTTPPVLQLPNPDLEFSVDTDASAYQVGCALFQNGPDGIRHPVGFWSRSLDERERKYSAGEREALAIIFAVKLLHPYLWGKHFKVYTDHQALRWVFSLDDPTGRLSRWALRLQDFDFEVRYKKGADNVVADTVSRLPTYGLVDAEVDIDIPVFSVLTTFVPAFANRIDSKSWITNDFESQDSSEVGTLSHAEWTRATDVFSVETAPVELITIDELIEEQAKDEECQRLGRLISSNQARDYDHDERGLLVRISPVDKAIQVFVPKNLRARALYLAHYTPVAGHPGVSKQYYTMRRGMYWPNMVTDVRQCCHDCTACARERVKLRSHQAPLKLFPPTQPLEFVAIDILGPLDRASTGHRFILVMTDRFSKFTRAVPMRACTALTVSKAFLEYWVFSFGAPAKIVSDNGSQFTSELFKKVCKTLGVRNLFTTTYHPQTNGQAERFNRTLLASLRAFVAEHPRTWPEFVGAVAYAYNTQVHTSTMVPPFDLVVTNPPDPMIIKRDETMTSTAPPGRQEDASFNTSRRWSVKLASR